MNNLENNINSEYKDKISFNINLINLQLIKVKKNTSRIDFNKAFKNI